MNKKINLELTDKEVKDILDYLHDTQNQYLTLNENNVANDISKLRIKIIEQHKKQTT